jgi:hypothetical protein
MTTLGFRVKSGRAVAVALSGTRQAPRLVLCYEVALCDPATPATRQPYHDGFGTAQQDEKVIASLTRTIERCARTSVRGLIEGLAAKRARACLVVGSIIDPDKVTNPHIRAHANEGRLFRTVLENALHAHGVATTVTVEKVLPAEASRTLGQPAAALERALGRLGKGRRPWRRDEKAAALAAWTLLSVEV